MSNQKITVSNAKQWAGVKGISVLAAITCLLIACSGQISPVLASTPLSDSPTVKSSTDAPNSYAAIVSRVAPAVVTIRADVRMRAPQQFPFLDDPFFQQFFGNRESMPQLQPRERREHALGSGVIVSPNGYILTNHHVIDGAEQIRVELNDNRTLDAKVVGSDPPSDLAVLKINATNLPVLPLGDSDHVRVGDVVLAIGNPLGVGQTVTMGIISAKGRTTDLSDGSFEDFLQTDAAINHGNSGGALVNTNGELIGISSQILSPSGGNIGIGFAIPANMARSVMDQLIKGGLVRRGKLGVTIQPVTADIASNLGLREARGALVNGVEPNGPAARAGVRRGDVIVNFNGSPVGDTNSLRNHVASTPPGTAVKLTVVRDGKEQTLRATLGELIAATGKGRMQGAGDEGSTKNSSLGMSVEPLTPALAERLDLPSGTTGLVVTDLDPAGPSADAGLQQGDVIVEVNRQAIHSEADLNSALQRGGARPALLLINRRGNDIYVTLRPRR